MRTHVKEYTHVKLITKKSKRGVWDLKVYSVRKGTYELCLLREIILDLLFQREIMGLFWDGIEDGYFMGSKSSASILYQSLKRGSVLPYAIPSLL